MNSPVYSESLSHPRVGEEGYHVHVGTVTGHRPRQPTVFIVDVINMAATRGSILFFSATSNSTSDLLNVDRDKASEEDYPTTVVRSGISLQKVSASRTILFMVSSVATWYRPLVIYPLVMTQSAPLYTALAKYKISRN